jgi:hypothetical protein
MSLHVTSCHTLSHLVTSCHFMSPHVISCHFMSSHVTSCHFMSLHVTSCHFMSLHVTSYHFVSLHVTSCYFVSRGLCRKEEYSKLARKKYFLFVDDVQIAFYPSSQWPRTIFTTLHFLCNLQMDILGPLFS